MDINDGLIETLLELQDLDRVPRLGFSLNGVADPESVSEHSWHVAFLVWCLSARISGIDRLRAVELALVHDAAEVRLGDLPKTAARYFPKGSKARAEQAAAAELFAAIPEALERHLEYSDGTTAEARLVKACDKLQLVLKLVVYESGGAARLAAFWDNPENFVDGGFPLVAAIYEELRTLRARRLDAARAP